MRWGPILNILFDLSQLSSSRAKEFHFRCHPLVMASLSGLLISVWRIALWDAVACRGPSMLYPLLLHQLFCFPRTLTCPGPQHRSMIILSSSSLRLSSLVSTKIGEKEESDLSAWPEEQFYCQKKLWTDCHLWFPSKFHAQQHLLRTVLLWILKPLQ